MWQSQMMPGDVIKIGSDIEVHCKIINGTKKIAVKCPDDMEITKENNYERRIISENFGNRYRNNKPR
jgi:sRNA-binding carbon storage regulator CsrA